LTSISSASERPVAKTGKTEKADQGFSVAAAELSWLDSSRKREVPVRIYHPTRAIGPLPVVVFSHGLGRSIDDYAYLGQYWAGRGYAVVMVRHPGSDSAAWKGSLRPLKTLRDVYADPATAVDRRRDLSFALDQLQLMQARGEPLAMRFDLDRIGAAGNDLGAQAVLVLAGQEYPGKVTRADPRIKALVLMSPPAPPEGVSPKTAFAQVQMPCLHLAGTNDDGIVGTTRADGRRMAFDRIFGADQYLITFLGGDHLIYAGHVLDPLKITSDAKFQRLICLSTTVFWNAYLKDDRQAKTWLFDGGLNTTLGKEGRLEMKLAPE
jgi:predicted dienelactone hydrolase